MPLMDLFAALALLGGCISLLAARRVLRRGDTPRPHRPAGRRSAALAMLFGLVLAGCAGPLDGYKVALDLSTRAYVATDASWAKQKTLDLELCLQAPLPPADSPACVEATLTRWAPRSAAIKALYAALTTAGLVLTIVETHAVLGKPLDTAPLAKAIEAVLAASRAVQAVAP